MRVYIFIYSVCVYVYKTVCGCVTCVCVISFIGAELTNLLLWGTFVEI